MLVKKNETQLKYLYGEELVNALKEAIKSSIKKGNVKTIPTSLLDDEDKLEKYLSKKFK